MSVGIRKYAQVCLCVRGCMQKYVGKQLCVCVHVFANVYVWMCPDEHGYAQVCVQMYVGLWGLSTMQVYISMCSSLHGCAWVCMGACGYL